MLVGIPHNVIFICIPNKLIWAENIRLPVVFQYTVLARTVMKIVKRNFLPLCNSRVDRVRNVVNALIAGFPVVRAKPLLQNLGLINARQPTKLFNQLLAFLFGDESRRFHRVRKQLQFRHLK